MPNIQAILFCDKASRDEHGFLALSGLFLTVGLATLPMKVNFFVVVVVSEITDDEDRILHFEFNGPSGFISRHDMTIGVSPTQFADFSIPVNGFPISHHGEYRLDVRFDDEPAPARVARFEVVEARTLLPASKDAVLH